MSARNDPRYMKLYHDYAKAIQAYQNSIAQRKRVRAQLTRRAMIARESNRRPVGSPEDFRIPQEPGRGAAPPRKPSVTKVYMGPILGWAKLVGTSPEYLGETQQGGTFDVNAAYDATSLKLHWNAKIHYEKCKRAFFDYVRRQNVDVHLQRAGAELDHQANLQMLGHGGENDLVEAQREMEGACRNAWRLYRIAPNPKPKPVILLLLKNFADAQFVGLQSQTTGLMDQEVTRLIRSGVLAQER